MEPDKISRNIKVDLNDLFMIFRLVFNKLFKYIKIYHSTDALTDLWFRSTKHYIF